MQSFPFFVVLFLLFTKSWSIGSSLISVTLPYLAMNCNCRKFFKKKEKIEKKRKKKKRKVKVRSRD